MTATARDGAIQSEPDQIMNLIAQRWATVTKCKVTINTIPGKKGVARRRSQISRQIGWQ